MAQILRGDKDFISAIGLPTYEHIWNQRMADVRKHLFDHPEARDRKHGMMVGLVKIHLPSGLKRLYYQFGYGIKSHENGHAMVEHFFDESILYEDGENIDEFLDRYNSLRELAASDKENYELHKLCD